MREKRRKRKKDCQSQIGGPLATHATRGWRSCQDNSNATPISHHLSVKHLITCHLNRVETTHALTRAMQAIIFF